MSTILKKALSVMTGMALAAPLAIGIAFAEDTDDAPPPALAITQECLTARNAADDALIAAKTALTSKEIAAIQAHKNAINAAFALTDTTAKATAFKTAEMNFRTAMKAAMETFHTSMQTSMEAMKTACGRKPKGELRMMEGREHAKKGLMNRIMKAFGRGKMKGDMGSSSSSSSAQ